MRRRWRYGLGVDLTVVGWAASVCVIGVLVVSGVVRHGFDESIVIFAVIGVAGVAFNTFVAWQTVRMVREARDGDVRGPGAR